ncbi:response regulator [Sulfobacillus thermosulfidooxidans]|uniref:response regulator n=1 Tax=Sulfobacillus thermosulfidooxidans TaxID=28034 RepID=UPI0006B4F2F9|nr:response regulator transcription factor [Sulfobacillus thermosulfidooxidans]
MYRVIIADDHELTRRGLRQVLSDTHEFRVVGEAADGNTAWDLIQKFHPEIALLDIRMDGLQGPAVCRLVKDAGLPTACIILTSYTDEILLRSALVNGARGYIIKDVTSLELIDNIRQVLTQGAVLDPKLTAHVIRWVEEDHLKFPDPLKPLDIRILSLVAEGFTNKEIGMTLNLSENTVKAHINAIVETLGAKNRVEAAIIAYRYGLI